MEPQSLTGHASAHQSHAPTTHHTAAYGSIGLVGQGGAQGVDGVDVVVDQDGLSIQLLLGWSLVRVLQQRVELGSQRAGGQLSLLKVFILGSISVGNIALLLATLATTAVS